MKHPWVLGVGVLLLAGALAAGRATSGSNKDALLQADRDFNSATASKGIDGFSSFLADNVRTLREDKPVVEGKASMTEKWRPLLSNPAMSIRWEPITAAVSDHGDLGYTIGMYEITKSDAQGMRTVGTGKYVTIWRKQKDGSWKVEFDSGVPDSAPGAAKPKN